MLCNPHLLDSGGHGNSTANNSYTTFIFLEILNEKTVSACHDPFFRTADKFLRTGNPDVVARCRGRAGLDNNSRAEVRERHFG